MEEKYLPSDNSPHFTVSIKSPILETILLLRELDVSIPEIQSFMKNRSAESLLNGNFDD